MNIPQAILIVGKSFWNDVCWNEFVPQRQLPKGTAYFMLIADLFCRPASLSLSPVICTHAGNAPAPDSH